MGENRPISLRIGAGAHRGLVREENQDRITRTQSPFGELFIVADGMGGHEGGATAAQMLIDRLGEHLHAQPVEASPEEALRQAAQQTNADIYRRAQDDRRLAKMGATGVLALIQGHRAWVAHAGDSRAYLWRGGRLERLTRDHTLVQRMVDRQILDEEEARNHPDASVVTRGFGQSPDIQLEVAPPLELQEGDRLLLCSDGLSGYVDDDAISQVLATGGEAQAASDALIDLALRTGGEDNVSLQVIAVQGATEAPAVPETAATKPPEKPLPEKPLPKKVPDPEETAVSVPRRGIPTFFLLLPLFLAALLAGALLPWKSWMAPETAASPPPSAAPDRTDLPADRTNPSDPTNDPTDPYGAAGTVPLDSDLGGPSLPEPVAGPLQGPRVTILLPPGSTAPELRQHILRSYPGNWSTPEPVAEEMAPALQDGRVYFRSGFDSAAADLAGRLGYAASPWPPALVPGPPETDLLVVHRRTP